MRNFIFEFEQEKALEFGLKLNELLLLDYMLKFFNTDRIKRQRKGERFYCRLTYNKVLGDLPILRIKERQLRNMIICLEKKGIVERFSELKNQMYLYVDFNKLFGNDLLDETNGQASCCLDVGSKVPTIDNYDNNKIKIKINNARIRELDLEIFNKVLHELLKERVSKISYDLFFYVTKAIQLEDDGIIFRVKWKERIEQAFMDKFTSIVEEAVSKFI